MKRLIALTLLKDEKILVNFDNVSYVLKTKIKSKEGSTIYFNYKTEFKELIYVKEDLNHILKLVNVDANAIESIDIEGL